MPHPLRAASLLLCVLLVGCYGESGAGNHPDAPAPAATAPVTQAAPAATAPVTQAAPAATAVQVTIDNFSYSPAQLTIAAGTRVTWLNRDDVPHTVTSSVKPRLLDSGTLDTDDHFEHLFETPGTYSYFCAVHPHMTGQIVVK